ncbi:hypothetical protein J437_LFUL001882, partial [Ladona fulva]
MSMSNPLQPSLGMEEKPEGSKPKKSVQLGFVSECEPWKLGSRFFPSKVGGKPSWLDLKDLPSSEELACDKCRKPRILLCQIYAPIDDQASCFHRSIFVFICRDADCCEENSNLNFTAFRCQLPRKNAFYPYEPPVEEETWRTDIKAEKYQKLCYICGNIALNACGRCQAVSYCSRSHQKVHWAAGHRLECAKNLSKDAIKIRPNHVLLKEYEIVIEPEDREEEIPSKSEEEAVKQYEDLVIQGRGGAFHGEAAVDGDLAAMAMKEDKAYSKFKKVIQPNPDQILRYERHGKPLWISEDHIPEEKDIPPCEICDGKRDFEFQ